MSRDGTPNIQGHSLVDSISRGPYLSCQKPALADETNATQGKFNVYTFKINPNERPSTEVKLTNNKMAYVNKRSELVV